MSLLYKRDLSSGTEVITPANYVQLFARGVGLPSCAVLCPLPVLTKYVLSQDKYEHQFVQGDIYVQSKKDFCFLPLAVSGAPATAMHLELLIVLGVKKVIFLGTAGSLQEEVQTGDIVVCQEALCAEGTSPHYVKGETVRPNASLLTALTKNLRLEKVNFHLGRHWTTDGVFRETKAEISHYQKQGVLTVDMEASAFLAVCRKRKVQGAAAFVVSDQLSKGIWEPDLKNKAVLSQLKYLFKLAQKSLFQAR